MAQATPTVSVIVPNYNHARFLDARLQSIFTQTRAVDELILLDDASTDGSVEVLRRYAGRPDVRLVVNESNSGSPFVQWNRGVRMATGQYIWIAESDDSARPELLEKLIAELEAHPDAGIAECNSLLMDQSGAVIGPVPRDAYPNESARWERSFVADGRREIRAFLYLQNTIPSASAVVFRRSAWERAGEADGSLSICGDWDQWVRILLHSNLCFVPDALNLSRVHQGTQRVATSCNGQYELESLTVQRRIHRIIDVPRGTVRKGADRYATSCLQHLRSGRYSGGLARLAACACRLLTLDRVVALRFLLRLPCCLTAGSLKKLRH